jgi:hypothetical protein
MSDQEETMEYETLNAQRDLKSFKGEEGESKSVERTIIPLEDTVSMIVPFFMAKLQGTART